MKLILRLLILLSLSFPLFSAELDLHDYPILTPHRLDLTREYAKRHYKLDTYILHEPQMIVIHYTAGNTLAGTLSTFKPDEISPDREKLHMFGKLNVGVHFVVDTNGDIYKLLPTTIMGRHVIGFNHVSIGIENVASNSTKLTNAQIHANAALVSVLIKQFPTIQFLIGHHEYMNRRLPHFALYTNSEPGYDPSVKVDPGFQFMDSLRDVLKNEYNIVLKD